MDQNRDWKPIAALVLAGLALFVALSGGRGGNYGMQPQPQQIIVQQPAAQAAPVLPAQPSGGTIVLPAVPQQDQGWDGPSWRNGHGFPLFVPIFFLLLVFVGFKVMRRVRYGWGGPGWGGPGRHWGGPGGGPQGPPQGQPYQQYPPQYGPGPQGQQQYPPQYGGYGQGPQQAPQGQQPPQGGQPTTNVQAEDAHGDITRPEGGSY